MSRSDTEGLVRRFLDAINASDSSAALACLAEDVAHDRPGGKREIGQDAFRQFLAGRLRGEEIMADIAIMTDEGGGRAAAEFTRRGRRAAGESYSTAAGLFFEIDDGLITRVSGCAGD